MKNRLTKYLILFSVLFTGTGKNVAYPCGWWGYEFEDIRFTLFNPDLLENKSWWAFLYTSHSYFMNGDIRDREDEKAISMEWKEHLGLSTSVDSIETYLFGNSSGERAKRNPFQQELNKNQQLKDFIDFAKKCESAVSVDDPWESVYTDYYRVQRTKLIKDGMKLLEKETDLFWKKKYAFQLIRLSYYQNDNDVFDTCYNTFYGLGNEKTPLDWWATHYRSMMLERQHSMDSANYLHALVFSNCSNKMYVSKKYFSEKQFVSVLSLAKNNKERADIYLIKEINSPAKSMNGIRRVYQLAPDHPLLPLLLIREVNKIENWIGTYKYSYTNKMDPDYYTDITKIGKDDYVYLQNFFGLVRQMGVVKKNEPAFYNLLCANLALLSADIYRAKKYLSAVKSGSEEMMFQKNVLETILIAVSEDIQQTTTQNRLADKLQVLIDTRYGKFKSQNMLYSLFRLLEYSFRIKKMNHLAGLFNYIAIDKLCESCNLHSFEYGLISYYDKNASAVDIEELLGIFRKKNQNKLEKFLIKPYSHSHFFEDVLGTKYLREGNILKAKETWGNIPNDFWNNYDGASTYLDEDPFSMIEYENKNKKRKYPYYNKKQIIDQLFVLDIKRKKNFRDWILLGNAWFNFSCKGNSWFMLEYEWSNYESKESARISAFALRKSLDCYKEAIKLSTNVEEKAQVTYYMAFFYLTVYEKDNYLQWAKKYEEFSKTNFYRSVNCTLTEAMNDTLARKKFFGWDWEYETKYYKPQY